MFRKVIESREGSESGATEESACKQSIHVWGDNSHGQLGLGGGKQAGIDKPVRLPFPKVVRTLAMGESHTAIVTDHLQLFVMGSNKKGQLGLSKDVLGVSYPTLVAALSQNRVADVQCGVNHTLALTEQSQVFGFGDNELGQLACG